MNRNGSYRLTGRHDLSDTELIADQFGVGPRELGQKGADGSATPTGNSSKGSIGFDTQIDHSIRLLFRPTNDSVEASCMSSHVADNEAIVRRDVREVWHSSGDLDLIPDIVTDDFVYRNPLVDEPVHGPDDYRKLAATFRDAFSDIDMEISEMVAVNDKVVTRYTTRAVHDGEFMDIEPTHNSIEITGIIIDHLEDGKLTERYINDDALGLFEQIGAIELP